MAIPFSNDLIGAAFENAKRDFKATLKNEKLIEEISKIKSIDEVYDTTDAIQREQATKGRLRHLSKIQPYLEGLRSYASVIEVFIQADQNVLPLLWGPVKLLLQWTNNLRQSFDAVIDALADIGLLLPEFTGVRELFSQNEHIKDVLVLFFRDILDFNLIVLNFFTKTYLGIVFEALWAKQRRKLDLVRDQIRRHTMLLRREVKLEQIEHAKRARLEALEHYEKVEKDTRQQEFNALQTNLCPRTYYSKLDWLHDRICQGTGRWLLKDKKFCKWLDKNDQSTRFLWLQGIPGAGKTFLSGTVVRHLKENVETRTIYAFLSYTFSDSLSALSIFHSLIFHLAEGHNDLQDILRQKTTENLKSNLDEAADTLNALLRCAGSAYIVIDGLDEIDEFERHRLLKRLLDVSRTCQDARFLVSSRAAADIVDTLKDQESIRVDGQNAGSIQTYVDHHTKEWFSRSCIVPEARAEIQTLLAPLASNAKGMFLYAKVVLTSIESLDNMEDIVEEFKVLPESLDAAYSRILQRINNLHPQLKDRVRLILGWVGCTPLPMTVQEIEQALIVSAEGVEGNAKVILTLDMPKMCGPIIEVIDGYVQFVHFTVQEYLFSSMVPHSIDFGSALCSLASSCITYLCQLHHEPALTAEEITEKILSGTYRLHDFAASTWFELVEHYLQQIDHGQVSCKLIDALEYLNLERSSGLSLEVDNSTQPLALRPLKDIRPDLYNTLCAVAQFHLLARKEGFSRDNSISWIHHDPLTISASSTGIYKRVNDILRGDKMCQKEISDAIQRHYGDRPFKCGFLECSFRRHGFVSRSAQRSHMKHHDRPWKCGFPGCRYADGGFLSQNMRDNHYKDHSNSNVQKRPVADDLHEDDIQPLLFDLIKADRVEDMKSLEDRFKALPRDSIEVLEECATSFGSPAMIDLVWRKMPKFGDNYPINYLVEHAIIAGNFRGFKHLLLLWNTSRLRYPFTPLSYAFVLAPVLELDSEEYFMEWERYANFEFDHWKLEHGGPNGNFFFLYRYISPKVITATNGHIRRENLLIGIWEKISLHRQTKILGDALVAVASTTCSLHLSRYLINKGAKVNHQLRTKNLTPLHHATRKNSLAAAELARYLLSQGADPELNGGRSNVKMRDEKGAKQISQWLGMSWDELIAKAKEEREEQSKVTGIDS